MIEQRTTIRALTHLSGHAVFDRAAPESLPCLVRNLSPIGACLVLCADVTVPDRFELSLDPSRQTYRVRKVWHHDSAVGVRFLETRENVPEVIPDCAEAAF